MAVNQDQVDAPSFAASRDGVGAILRQMREERGQDIESVARALRIRHPYLVAIEEGRYRDLPGAPYASGFVRSYAEFLGLDAVEILRRFRDESGGLGGRTELVFPAPVSEGGFPAAVLIGLVLILAAVVYGIWYFYQWHRSGSAEAVSTLPDRLTALIHAPGGQDEPDADTSGGAQASPAPAETQVPAQATTPAPVTVTAAAPASDTAKSPAPAAPPPTSAPASNATQASPPPQPTPVPAAPQPAASDTATPPPAAAPAATNAPAPSPAAQTPPAPTPAAQAPAPQPVEVAKAETASEAPPPPTVTGTANQAAPPAPELGQPSRVVLRASEDCWIEIRDGTGAVVTARMLHRGDTYPVPPRPGLTLTVGNAGALALLLDGSPLPPLGKAGMVRHDVSLDPERLSGTAPAAANPAPAPSPPTNPND